MKNIVLFLSKHEHSFHPMRLISSEFFFSGWNLFSRKKLSKIERHFIQEAARNSFDYAMNGEPVYWNMDFSESNARAAWEKFYRSFSMGNDIQSRATDLVQQLLVSEQDSRSNGYFTNMITRLRFDEEYRQELAYDEGDAEILNIVYEQTSELTLDMEDIETGWINSNKFWDKKLKSQTPDIPESVYLIFSRAYDAHCYIPLLRKNIDRFFGNKTINKNKFLSRLRNVHKESSVRIEGLILPLAFAPEDC